MLAWIRCLMRNRHDPQRHPLGGFRCSECGLVGADLDDMGFAGSGYVSPMRHVFSRNRREITRTAAWEPSRGTW
jgi:hypothetical protein